MFKKYLLCFYVCAAPIIFLPSLVLAAGALHAIIVADENDVGIGAGQDVAAIQKLTSTIRQAACLGGKDEVITVGKGKYSTVETTLKQLRAGADDVVFFYYSGHGANPGGEDPWPTLCVECVEQRNTGKSFKLSSINSILQSKNPRLLITIADACNSFTDERMTQRGRRQTEQPEIFKKLFLYTKGNIIASSSRPGQASFGGVEKGGQFTEQFLDSLNQVQASANSSWDEVKEKAIKNLPVPEKYREQYKQEYQTPQMKVEVTYVAGARNGNSGQTCFTGPTPGSFDEEETSSKPDQTTTSDYPKCKDGGFRKENGKECCLTDSGKKRCFNY